MHNLKSQAAHIVKQWIYITHTHCVTSGSMGFGPHTRLNVMLTAPTQRCAQ